MPLIVVPTPIGNLRDMTLRGLEALQNADLVACEDTRHTLKLLNHFGIRKPLISYHEHNEIARLEPLIKKIEAGENVVLVSDAGTPGLSDPGGVIVRAVVERGLPIDVLPGANALLPALLLSGLEMDSFYFAGFLRGKRSEQKTRLMELKEITAPLVFYISPHKLLRELQLMGGALGDRGAALVREISKIHQETLRATLLTFKDIIPVEKIRGEFVCVVEGAPEKRGAPEACEAWRAEAVELRKAGESTRNIANLLSVRYCISKNLIKDFILHIVTEQDR